MTSEIAISHFEFCQTLIKSGKFTKYPVPSKGTLPSDESRSKFSHAKSVKELGLQFTSIEKSIVDMAEALISLGIVAERK